jgi:hypothetical protein
MVWVIVFVGRWPFRKQLPKQDWLAVAVVNLAVFAVGPDSNEGGPDGDPAPFHAIEALKQLGGELQSVGKASGTNGDFRRLLARARVGVTPAAAKHAQHRDQEAK